MTLQIADRVKELSTTTGTGALTLAGAVTGFRAFSAVCTSPSDTCYYALQAVDGSGVPTGEWEVGLGTYSAANTLTRTTVLASSNAGSAVNFAAGTKQVWIDIPAAQVAADPIYMGSANRPTTAAFTLTQSSLSSGTATMANLASGRGFIITCPQATAASDCTAHALQTVPGGGSWTITALLQCNGIYNGSYSSYGIAIKDATGKFVFFGGSMMGGYDPAAAARENWSSFTSFSSRSVILGASAAGTPCWMRLVYDGTNFTFYTSLDGETWCRRYAMSATDFIGAPVTCGIHADANNRSPVAADNSMALSVYHYEQG
jgi:hypothetical protein